MSYLPKQQRYAYERLSGVNTVLQNLRGYQLATGQASPSDIHGAFVEHGSDKGRVLGALLSGDTRKRKPLGEGKRKKRKKRRSAKEKDAEQCSVVYADSTSVNQFSAIPRHDSPQQSSSSKVLTDRESDHVTDHMTDEEAAHAATGSLGLLAGYGTSSSESESDVEEYGGGKDDKETFAIPGVIQDMFEVGSGKRSEGPSPSARQLHHPAEEGEEGEEEEGLGFFASADSDSEGEDGGGRAVGDWREDPRWDAAKSQWVSAGPSPLSSYLCWKCRKTGHLPHDCTVKESLGKNESDMLPKISQQLQTYYAKCRELKGRGRGSRCVACGVTSNLAVCLECGSVLCDGRGHLASHLLEHASHRMLFSHKLGRMLKCCKASCDVVDVYELRMCSHCLGKAFSQHYSMFTASWSRSGLRLIPNALCCEDHFHWHRINCPTACEETLVSVTSLREQSSSGGTVSEFFF